MKTLKKDSCTEVPSRASKLSSSLLFFCRGKNQRLSSIFDSCWRNEVSNFCLSKFAEVVPFCEFYVADVDVNTKNSKENSELKETMQKVLVLIA